MIPVYLKLENYMAHSLSVIDFYNSSSKIFLIIGQENNAKGKSNAVGKTTLFTAIEYALFNHCCKSSFEKLIRHSQKKMEVIFDFQLSDNKIYRIIRTRSKMSKEVKFMFCDKNDYPNNWVSLSARTDGDTDKKILNILKINRKTFNSTCYFNQKEIDNFLNVEPSKRKSVIKEMLRLNEWELYREAAKNKKSSALKDYSTAKSLVNSLGNPEQELNDNEEMLIKISSQLKEVEKEIKENEKSKTLLQKELDIAKQNISANDIDTLNRINYLNQQKNTINTNKIKNLIKSAENSIYNLNNEVEKYTKDLNNKQKQLNELSPPEQEEIDKQKYEEIVSKINEIKFSIAEKEAAIKILNKKMPDDDFCPSCGTELNNDKVEQLLQSKQQRIKDNTDYIQENKKTLSELVKEKNNTDLIAQNIKTYKETKSNLERSINLLQNNINSNNDNLELYKMQLENNKNELEQSNIKLIEIETELSSLSCSVKDNKDVENKISILLSDISKIDNNTKVLRQKQNTLLLNKGRCDEAIRTSTVNLEKMLQNKELLDKSEKTYKLASAALDIFGPQGVSLTIIKTVLDSLQHNTNKILEVLRPNIKMFFITEKSKGDEKEDVLNIGFYIDGREGDYTDLSGGQEASVLLALKFAAAIVNKERCGADISMLLLDEVDKALDDDGIDAFFNVLKVWSKKMTIMVITHNQRLKSKFKSFIQVDKNNNITSAYLINE